MPTPGLLPPLLLALIWACPPSALALPFSAQLIAEHDCLATTSIRHENNPGRVRLKVGSPYRVIARNRSDASHYQVRIDGAQPSDRWVAVECGRLATGDEDSPEGALAQAANRSSAASNPDPSVPMAARPPKGRSMDQQFVLAVTWQPAFCERRAGKPECRSQTTDGPDARRFSLHGLWPQPMGAEYCGVGVAERQDSRSGDWRQLPPVALDSSSRAALAERMPGVASYLDRHEWIKHGTCYGTDADTYFDQAMALLDQLNGSKVQGLFEANIGNRLRADEVRRAFDQDFGPGTGERVRLECDEDGLIAELRIGLKGAIGEDSRLTDLIRQAPTRTQGCRGGWVDKAGRGR